MTYRDSGPWHPQEIYFDQYAPRVANVSDRSGIWKLDSDGFSVLDEFLCGFAVSSSPLPPPIEILQYHRSWYNIQSELSF